MQRARQAVIGMSTDPVRIPRESGDATPICASHATPIAAFA